MGLGSEWGVNPPVRSFLPRFVTFFMGSLHPHRLEIQGDNTRRFSYEGISSLAPCGVLM